MRRKRWLRHGGDILRYAPVLILLSILLMGLSTVPVDSDNDDIDLKEALVEEETRAEFSLDDRNLKVLGNDELLQARDIFGWPGVGTKINPIIIADRTFNGDGNWPALRFDNTTLSVIIQNCSFYGGRLRDIEIEDYRYKEWDLFLRNSSSVDIRNCVGQDSSYFSFLDCDNIILLENGYDYREKHFIFYNTYNSTIEGNDHFTLNIEGCGNFEISNNTFLTSAFISQSNGLHIDGNLFSGVGEQITQLDSCQDLELTDNIFKNHTIYFYGGSDQIESLKMDNNSINGFDLKLIKNKDLEGEEFTGNLGHLLLFNVSNLNIGLEGENTEMIGLQTWECEDVRLQNTDLSSGSNSVSFAQTKNLTIERSIISSFSTVILITDCDQINISHCSIYSGMYSQYASIKRSENIILLDNNFSGGFGGIRMLDCNNSLIMNNIMGAYYGGFHLEGICLNNRILNNSFTHGVIGLDLEGESLSTLDLGNENTISGKPIIFLKGEYDPEILEENDIYQLIIFDLHDMNLSELSRFGFNFGLYIFYSSDLLFEKLNFSREYGLYIQNSETIRISNGTFINSFIFSEGGGWNTVDNSTFSGRHTNIFVERATYFSMNENMFICDNINIEITDTNKVEMSGTELAGDYTYINFEGSSEVLFHANSLESEQGNIEFQECDNISFGKNTLAGRGLGVEFNECEDVHIFENWMHDSNGFFIVNVEDLILRNNYISNLYGSPINLVSVSGFYMNNNTILESGGHGISLRLCQNFTLSDNTIKDHKYAGILIHTTHNGILIGNDLTSNGDGIYVNQGSNILVTGNNIERNKEVGIYINKYSENNTIWDNTFDRNNDTTEFRNLSRYQASDHGTKNTWFMDFGGGNMWSDWRGDDKDADGFVDDPYLINGSAGSFDEKPRVWELEGEEVNGGVLDLSSGTWCFVMIIAFAALVFLVGKILREGKYDYDKNENM